MTRPIRLDVHAHLVPVDLARLVALEGVSFDADEMTMTVDGHRVGMKALFQPERLLAWMEDKRVEHAWVSVPPPVYRQHLTGRAGMMWTDYLNAGLERIARASNGRLSALMHLPTQDPDLAASIAGAMNADGVRLFAMPTGTGDDRGLSDPSFEPLWQTLDDAEAFVFFHPGECADGRLKSFYLGNLLGNPYESSVAISHLVLGGILDRYRKMQVCFAHGGGAMPMVAGRFQRGYETDRPGLDKSVTAPVAALRRLRVDCICHDEATIGLAERVVGASNVVFGSDWPFPMGLVEPEIQMSGYSDERLNRLFCENPLRLLARYADH